MTKVLVAREWVARVVCVTGAGTVWRRLASGGNRITILAYHRVYDIGKEDAFPFDLELVSATPADFRWQMEHVARVGTPVNFTRLAEALDGGAKLPSRPILITFDDGYRDTFTHAFPVLRDLRIPATVFLSTAYVGEAGTFWFDRVAQLLHRAPRGCVHVPAVGFDEVLGDNVSSRRECTHRLLLALKGTPDLVRRRALAELEGALGTCSPLEDDALSGVLTWDEVRTMARGGVEFGSHAASHPILSRLEDGPLAEELASSRRVIQEETGQPVTAIAYPDGGPASFDERVVSAVVRAGYRFGVSYVSGVNSGMQDRYRLKRLPVERYMSQAYFEAMLAAPHLFAYSADREHRIGDGDH